MMAASRDVEAHSAHHAAGMRRGYSPGAGHSARRSMLALRLTKGNISSWLAFRDLSLTDSRNDSTNPARRKSPVRDASYPPAGSKPMRVQGARLANLRFTRSVAHVSAQMEAHYRDDVVPDKKENSGRRRSEMTLKTSAGRAELCRSTQLAHVNAPTQSSASIRPAPGASSARTRRSSVRPKGPRPGRCWLPEQLPKCSRCCVENPAHRRFRSRAPNIAVRGGF